MTVKTAPSSKPIKKMVKKGPVLSIKDPLSEMKKQTLWVNGMIGSIKSLISNRRQIISRSRREIKIAKKTLKELTKISRVTRKITG